MEVREGLRIDIGRGLQWLRKSLALTQYQLASLAQLDYRHYQNIETGRVEVKVETLNRICEALGIVLSVFFSVIDRKPWLIDKPLRSRGGGELYVFRIEHEHSRFTMYDEVRHILSDWGHDLSEGHRENLDRVPYPCFETDRNGRCLWKNASTAHLRIAPAGGSLEDLFPTHAEFESFVSALDQLFERKTLSIYQELQLRLAAGEELRRTALMGLRPFAPKDTQSLFMACVDLSVHARAPQSEAGSFLQQLMPITSAPKHRLRM